MQQLRAGGAAHLRPPHGFPSGQKMTQRPVGQPSHSTCCRPQCTVSFGLGAELRNRLNAQPWSWGHRRHPPASTVLSRAGITNLQIKDSSDGDGEKVTAILQLVRSLETAAEERGWCWGEHVPLSPLGYWTPVSIPSWLCPAVAVVLAGTHISTRRRFLLHSCPFL